MLNASALRFQDRAATRLQRLRDREEYDALQARLQKIPKDRLAPSLFPGHRFLRGFKTAFITFPKTVWRGLSGAEDFTFADTMLMSKFPFYVGGAMLALSPGLVSRVPLSRNAAFIQQAAAVVLYLAGLGLTNTVVNTLYRLRYGIDLSLQYKTPGGQYQDVFASTDFTRFDLLTPNVYHQIGQKIGIPDNLLDPEGGIKEQIRLLVTSSRTVKILVGNLASALFAGYFARSIGWMSVLPTLQNIGTLWKTQPKSILTNLSETGYKLVETLQIPLKSFRRSLYAMGALAVGTIGYILFHSLPPKTYDTKTSIDPQSSLYFVNHPQSAFSPYVLRSPAPNGGRLR